MGKHITVYKDPKEHKAQDGCLSKHETAFDNPSFPKCAYRPNGYNATVGESVTGLSPSVSKRSLYEYDFTVDHPDGTPIEQNHKARLPPEMESVKQTGRQTKEDKQANKPRTSHPNQDPRQDAKAWHFVGDNYKKDWFRPFGHEYHHIMPQEAIASALDEKEARLLLAAGYNINIGKNIIILPISRDVAYALMLPKHKSAHKSYNEHCKSVINKYKQIVDEELDGHGITEGNVGGLKKNLEDWAEDEYANIVQYGRDAALAREPANMNKMYKK